MIEIVRIAIVEDDKTYADQLIEFLGRYQVDNGLKITYDLYTNGAMLTQPYDKEYGIIFMDIDMPVMDGMSAAKEIRKVDGTVIIIFITNMAQYAIKGYSVNALDYLLKPIGYFAFSQCLNKAITRLSKLEDQYIAVCVNRRMQKINLTDIYYIESMKHTLTFYTSHGEYVTNSTLKVMEASLADKFFARGGSGFLINLRHVDAIRDGCAIVRGKPIPLSRSRKASFEKALINYISEVTK